MVLLEVNHEQLETFIDKHYQTNLSLFIWGTTGIGKSESMEKKARDIAKEHKREFIKWNSTTKKMKKEISEHPEKYFILMDIRLSQMDPSDLKGLPGMSDIQDTVDWKIPFWLYVATLPNAEGFLFFDEINLAPPSIQASAYQLILDRALGEVTISKGFSVFAAGNRVEDKANVYDLPKPLQNRFDHVTLKIPSVEDWTQWALDNNKDSRIISFINARPALLMPPIKTKSNDMAFPTPRTWGKNCNELIKGVSDIKQLEILASSCVGRGASMEFASFLKFQRKINLKEILDNPKSVTKIQELDLKYSLLSLVSEWYEKHNESKHLEKILQIANYIQPEFAILLLRFAKAKHQAKFKKQVPTLKTWKTIWNKYGKYFDLDA
jgi:hypothetical protein